MDTGAQADSGLIEKTYRARGVICSTNFYICTLMCIIDYEIRMISMRKATRHEQTIFYNQLAR